MRNMTLRAALVGTFVAALTLCAHAEQEHRIVVLTGNDAPGMPSGARFELLFHEASIGESDRISFVGRAAMPGGALESPAALWIEEGGQISLLVRQNDPISGVGAEGQAWSFFPAVRHRLNKPGHALFMAFAEGEGADPSNRNMLVFSDGESLTLVESFADPGWAPLTRSGDAPAHLAFHFHDLQLNDHGHVLYTSYFSPSVSDLGEDRAIYFWSQGVAVEVVRAGDPVPGEAPGVIFQRIGDGRLVGDGAVIFYAALDGPGVGIDDSRSLWRWHGGQIEPVARAGDAAPGAMNAAFTLEDRRFMLNPAADAIAFTSALSGADVDAENNQGVWIWRHGEISLVARRGDPAPGFAPGVVFGDVSMLAMAPGGGLLIASAPIDPETGAGPIGHWIVADGSVGPLASIASFIPDALPESSLRAIRGAALTTPGQAVIACEINSPSAPFVLAALIATSTAGKWELIAHSTGSIKLAPFDVRDVDRLHLTPLGQNPNHVSFSTNDGGRLAFPAVFTDGERGLFVSSRAAPCPADLDGDCVVGSSDLVALIAAWATSGSPADLDGDGVVGSSDLAALLSAWGPCS